MQRNNNDDIHHRHRQSEGRTPLVVCIQIYMFGYSGMTRLLDPAVAVMDAYERNIESYACPHCMNGIRTLTRGLKGTDCWSTPL